MDNNAAEVLERVWNAASAPDKSSMTFSVEAIEGLATRWYPYSLWATLLTMDASTPNDYGFVCFNCWFGEAIQEDNTFTGFNAFNFRHELTGQPASGLEDIF